MSLLLNYFKENGLNLWLVDKKRPATRIKSQGKEKEFHTQKVILPKGSKVYICTDGLSDQHNLKGKKFGSLRLKKLISRIYKLPMDGQQKTLEEVLELHQKGQHQRDDITLIGFKV